jgi:hypothetical protein
MGTKPLLDNLATLQFEAEQIDYRIDDSERTEDPFWVRFRSVEEFRDVSKGRYHQNVSVVSAQFAKSTLTLIDDGNALATGTGARWATRPSINRIALGPERILSTAEQGADLTLGPMTAIHGVPHYPLRFHFGGASVTVYVNADSYLPDSVESVRTDPYDLAQSAWGDVTWRTDYLFWRREADGLVYPRQWSTSRNGTPSSVYEILSLIENPALPADTFTLPAAAQTDFASNGHTAFADLPLGNGTTNALAKIGQNIWLLAGNWNVLIVRQPDGLVVVECPQSGGYSKKVLAYLDIAFPGVPVKAVVSTTDALWHFAGARTYVARGIPIYALDLTIPLLTTFLAAPHTLDPDELSLRPRAADLRAVSKAMTIGDGSTAIQVIPIRGNGDERMLMVYFPQQRLLYGSSNDVAKRPSGAVGTFNLPDIVSAVQRLGISVNTYVAIHTLTMPWSTVLDTAHRALLN